MSLIGLSGPKCVLGLIRILPYTVNAEIIDRIFKKYRQGSDLQES